MDGAVASCTRAEIAAGSLINFIGIILVSSIIGGILINSMVGLFEESESATQEDLDNSSPRLTLIEMHYLEDNGANDVLRIHFMVDGTAAIVDEDRVYWLVRCKDPLDTSDTEFDRGDMSDAVHFDSASSNWIVGVQLEAGVLYRLDFTLTNCLATADAVDTLTFLPEEGRSSKYAYEYDSTPAEGEKLY